MNICSIVVIFGIYLECVFCSVVQVVSQAIIRMLMYNYVQ